MYRKLIICFSIFLVCQMSFVSAQTKPAFLTQFNAEWVDSVFQTLSLEQKIGQLLMPRGNFSGRAHDIKQLKEWVQKYKIGGLVFFAGNPSIQIEITNELQSLSEVPLFIGQDFEWGLAMRLDSTIRFPYALSLGALTQNQSWIETMGEEMGKQCKRMGVHINYAPVVDINNNPANPVINFRSFGENKEDVANKAWSFVKGMEKSNIICTAKHFPGHGNTGVDSHHDLPIITATIDQLHQTELWPFTSLIKKGLPGIMSAHIHVPALDSKENFPSTLSRPTITDLLRKELGFEGLVFTDAMDMQAVVKNFSQGEAVILALIAGNDIIETFIDVPTVVEAIKQALKDGRLTNEWLDFKVRKILKAKSWVGLDSYKTIPKENLIPDLNSYQSTSINHVLAASSLTLLKNENNVLPLNQNTPKTVFIFLNPPIKNELLDMVLNYGQFDMISLSKQKMDSIETHSFLLSLESYEKIVVAAFFTEIRPAQQYGLNEKWITILNTLANHPNNILLWLGNPYGLPKIEFSSYKAILTCYQETAFTQKALGQAIFGAIDVNGQLPVSIHPKLFLGLQKKMIHNGLLKYGLGELTAIQGQIIQQKVDSMMSNALSDNYFPGAVVEIVYKGNVILQQAFGNTVYTDQITNQNNPTYPSDKTDVMDGSSSGSSGKISNVQPNKILPSLSVNTIYDLASVTKVAATALVLMRWVDEGKIRIDQTLADHLPELKNTPIGQATFRDLLTHRSGLPAWIPFWKTTIDSVETLKKAILRNPELAQKCVIQTKKPFFLFRWFGRKPKQTIDYEKTVKDKNNELWNVVVSVGNIIWKKEIYSSNKQPEFSIYISDSMWLRNDFPDEILTQIANTPIGKKGTYVYSDLHYYFYPKLCLALTGKSFEDYLDEIYDDIGLSSFSFSPLDHYSKNQIAPTEMDSSFRNTLIHGNVHDEGAIMMAGVSGHAGLFGNANDLTKLMYLYLNKGQYGNQRFLSEEVILEFTRYQFPLEKNRRGLAFDKKDFTSGINNAPSLASDLAFGHSGFTGTYVWADPKHELVFVFLSNRVFPSRDNKKISENFFRQKLCDEVYKVIINDSEDSKK
ncbi:MAG: glycoside hydrolase family 3 N-terminal domain-containing protein [Saprospiraceae bacterium]